MPSLEHNYKKWNNSYKWDDQGDNKDKKRINFSHSLVSIVIPVYNKVELTKQCIEAIFKNTVYPNYEIIIVNNASTDDTFNYLDKLKEINPKIKVINNNENLGFAKAINQGANIASGKYLVLLNNDTIPLENWLTNLINTINSNDKIAIVGCKLLYPDDSIQHCGVALRRDRKWFKHPYKFVERNHPIVNNYRKWDAVTAACIITPTDLFHKVGHLDEYYLNGCEDIDYCCKVREAGYEIYYEPKVELYHLESQSERINQNENDIRNFEYFISKWGNNALKTELEIYVEDGLWEIIGNQYVHKFNDYVKEWKNKFDIAVQQNNVQEAKRLQKIFKHLYTVESWDFEINNLPRPENTISFDKISEKNYSNNSQKYEKNELSNKTQSKLRILFICHDFPPYRYAGAQLFAKNLAQAINKAGKAQVEILYPQFRDKNKQDYSITQTTYEDLTVFELNKPAAGEPGKVFNQNIAQSIYQFLSQNHYDLIHIHGLGQITMAPVFIAAKMQIKMIMTLHDFWFICTNWHLLTNNQDICTGPESIEKCALCFITDSPYHTKTEENYKKSIDFISERNLIFKEAYYKISKFYAPSNYLKNVFNKYGFFNIDVLNNGLTHKELSVNNRIRDDRNIIFGFTGQIIKRKGVIFLLEAFIAISNPNIELHIYGKIDVESDYGKNIQNMINSDNRIKYFGEYKNEKINEILSTLDIVVIPTLMDNYPITVQEAFYNKVPVIASNIGGIPEMVSHNKNGILTEPSSVSDLKNAMLKIIDHPELINKFKENIPYIKSLEDNAREYLAEYNQILDNKIDLNKNSNNIILNEIKENKKIKILFYFFKNVHIPILEPIYRKLKAMQPEAQIAFGYMSYAPQIRAGFTPEEFELLKDFGEKLYNNPQDYNPDITFIADSCYEFVQKCGLLVHVGHGILSKGQYYTDTQLARREEYADLVCVPGEYHKKILNRIISKPVVATGMAKLDALYDGTYTREKIIQKYGLNPQNKFILYAPTFNDELSAIPFVYDRINEVIPDNNTFLLIKLHSSTKQEYKNMYRELFRKDARVIYIEDLNIAPYLALADIMISDVSSAMIEFASLDKPLILFNNPTWTTYKYYNPNDIEFKWRDIGIEVNNLEEMKQAVIRSLNTPKEFSHKRIYYTEQIIANKTYADASQKIINSALELLNKRVNIHSGVRI